MTVSTHVYAAYLIGSPDVELSVRGGTITLDAGSAPHVRGSLEIALPEGALLSALDPRQDARVRVEVDAILPGGTQHREFDLGLRDRAVRHADATLSLELASDEALLGDYAPLTDDDGPLTHQSSLRDVVDYVLDKAIPGAALEALPSNDADATAYWSLSNLLPNPGAVVDASKWTAAANCSIFLQTAGALSGANAIGILSAAAGALSFYALPPENRQKATPGKEYTFRFGFKSNATARTARPSLRWVDSQGNWLQDDHGTVLNVSVTTWLTLVFVTATAPSGADSVLPYVTVGGGTAPGQGYYVDNAALYEGRFTGYFDGSSTDAHYVYAWANTPGLSTSTREPLVERLPDALVWKAGQSALDFLHPLVQVSGLRLVCDEARKWTLRDETHVSPGALSIRHGVNLIDGTDTISRESGTWYDAAATRHTWRDGDGVQQERVDAYAITIPYTRLQTFEKSTPYPGPGFSEYAVRRAQGRGREVTATVVSDWRAQAEQALTVALNDTPTQTGLTQSVRFDLDNDEMTVTGRTTDTPDGVIDLLTGTIDALAGYIDAI